MTGSVLSPGTAALILFGVFFLLLFLRVPIAFALALACLPILLIEPRLSAMTLAQETFNAYNSFILLAVPFFLLTANLMNVGGITDRLVRFSRALVGHFPGGLAQVNVVLSIFFAGISGSSTADAASQSQIFIPAQRKEGYPDSFSAAITAPPRMCAVVGMLKSASVRALCAMPPVRSANHSAALLAIGMKVGFGRSASCSVRNRIEPNGPRLGRSAIALSSVCMTSRMIVRRDQCFGNSTFARRRGCRTICPSSFSGRVRRVPSPTSSV